MGDESYAVMPTLHASGIAHLCSMHANNFHSCNGVHAVLQKGGLSQASLPAGIWCVNLINQLDVTICIFAKLVFGVHQQ